VINLLFLALRIIAIVSVVFCGILNQPSYAAGVFFAMVLYALVAIKVCNDDYTKLESHADQIYFLGYLSTLSAFATAIYLIWQQLNAKADIDTQSILLMTGVALATTVVGLLIMCSLKEHAQSKNISYANEIKLFNPGINIDLKDIGGFKNINDNAKKSAEEIKLLNNEIENLKNQISGLEGIVSNLDGSSKLLLTNVTSISSSVRNMKESIDQGNTSAKQFKNNIKELQSVLNEFVKLLNFKINVSNTTASNASNAIPMQHMKKK